MTVVAPPLYPVHDLLFPTLATWVPIFSYFGLFGHFGLTNCVRVQAISSLDVDFGIVFVFDSSVYFQK